MTLFEWQTEHFIGTASCMVVQSNKVWNRKIHGWFSSHFLNSLSYSCTAIFTHFHDFGMFLSFALTNWNANRHTFFFFNECINW